MPQKPLKVSKTIQKKPAANRHGKTALTKKGKFVKPPKKGILAKNHEEAKELTKLINARNESNAAGMAAKSGGRLNVVKPPVLASAEEKKKGKKATEGDAMDTK